MWQSVDQAVLFFYIIWFWLRYVLVIDVSQKNKDTHLLSRFMFIVSLFGLSCLILYIMRGMYLLEENIFEMDVEPPTFQNGFQK